MGHNDVSHDFPSITLRHWYDTPITPEGGRRYKGWFQVKNTGAVPVEDIKIYVSADDSLERWDVELVDVEGTAPGNQYVPIQNVAAGKTSVWVRYRFTFIPLREGEDCEAGTDTYSFTLSPVYRISYSGGADDVVTDKGSTKC